MKLGSASVMLTSKGRKERPQQRENSLLFIETNIFLDFYRMPGESALHQLEILSKIQEKIIFSDQVFMEFLKHRQEKLIEAYRELNIPKPKVPLIVKDRKQSEMLQKHLDDASKSAEKLKKDLLTYFKHPGRDPIYKMVKALFSGNSPFVLKRPKKERYSIRSLARKRFILGYPPRKKGETMIGDAINWEWIVHCANNHSPKADVVIVSRDSDFGVKIGNDVVINDWLRLEFRERVSGRCTVSLDQKLSSALQKWNIKLSDKDITAEDEVLAFQIDNESQVVL